MKEKYWHVIENGNGCPSDSHPVIAIWVIGDFREGGLAYYDPDTKEWTSLNVSNLGDPLIEPKYWIELPETVG